MILICAWCKGNLGEKGPWSNKDVTHGICKPCADDLKKKYRMSDVLSTDDVETIENYLDNKRSNV